MKRDGSQKDTLRNIRETGELVIHTVTAPMVEAIDRASKEFPYGESEIEAAGLHTASSMKVKPPRILECPVALEAKLYREVVIGDGKPGSSTLIIAEVLMVHVQKQVLDENSFTVEFSKLDAISRLGRADYGRNTSLFNIDSTSHKR